MKNYFILLFSFITLFLNAQIKETRTVSSFSEIDARTGANVSYQLSNTPKIVVETDNQENLQYIITKVTGNTLEIYIDSKNEKNLSIKTFNVLVYGPDLKSIESSSGASIVFKDKMSVNNLEINLSSGSKVELGELYTTKNLEIKLSSAASLTGNIVSENTFARVSSASSWKSNLQTKKLTIDSSSSANITLNGTTNQLIVEASSSAKNNLKEFKSLEAEFKASSSGNVNAWVTNKFNAKASSSGKITIKGNPTATSVSTSSSGKIKNDNGNNY